MSTIYESLNYPLVNPVAHLHISIIRVFEPVVFNKTDLAYADTVPFHSGTFFTGTATV